MKNLSTILVAILKYLLFILLFVILMNFSFNYMEATFISIYKSSSCSDWTDAYHGEISFERVGVLFILFELIVIVGLSALLSKILRVKYSLYIALIIAHIDGLYIMINSILVFDGFIFLTLYCITIYITVIALSLGTSMTQEKIN